MIFCSIRPIFSSYTILFIIFSFSFISCSINIYINSIATSLIFLSLPFIYISVIMNQSSFYACFIFYPIPFILRPIRKQLKPKPMPLVIFIPFSYINSSIFQFYWVMLYSWLIFRKWLCNIIRPKFS